MTNEERATIARLIHRYEESAEDGPDAARVAAEEIRERILEHVVSHCGKIYLSRGDELIVVDLEDVIDVTEH